jgi:hypothetical protein
MGPMAIYARHAAMSVLRAAPLCPGGALILLVALQTSLGAGHRIAFLETEDQPRLSALSFQMAARRPMARLARVSSMYVVGE